MARITNIQHFESISHLKSTFGTVLPKPYDWRLLPLGVSGAIHALPTTQGVAIATNGILVAIMQESRLFIGHLDTFVPDQQEVTLSFRKEAKELLAPKSSKPSAPHVDISEFI